MSINLLDKLPKYYVKNDIIYETRTNKEVDFTKEKLVNQLFIGKVSELIGFDKTVELLKESKEAFKL